LGLVRVGLNRAALNRLRRKIASQTPTTGRFSGIFFTRAPWRIWWD